MSKKKLIDKKSKKKNAKQCYFCGMDNYASLACHRIVAGADGGEYYDKNVVVVCANCHTSIHDGQIVIDRWYLTSSGTWVLHFWHNGEEVWK